MEKTIDNMIDKAIGTIHGKMIGNDRNEVTKSVHDKVTEKVYDEVTVDAHDDVIGTIRGNTTGKIHDKTDGKQGRFVLSRVVRTEQGYGLFVSCDGEENRVYHDVTGDLDRLCRFSDIINASHVSPLHIDELIEDFLE